MAQWYLLHCKARQEARAKLHVENQGYTTCLPTITVEKIIRGKRQIVEEALFPSYLFIEIDMESANFNAIRSTRGVNGFVRFGGVPTKVPEAVVAQFQALEASPKTPKAQFEEGATVEITDGPFAGLSAVYKLRKGEDRCLVLLEMMGKQQQLEVHASAIKNVR